MNQLFGLQHRGDRHLGYSSRHTQVPLSLRLSCDYQRINGYQNFDVELKRLNEKLK